MSLRLALLKTWLRWVEKPKLAKAAPMAARASFERQSRLFRDPPFALYLHDDLNGVPVTWASSRARRSEVILWCHGGAHIMGSARTHRAMLARLSAMTGLRACLPDYRRAPEAPFPASLDDMARVWTALRERGYAAQDIVLGGDSSGGGVALALLSKLLAEGESPAALVAIAPFTDLTGESASFSENAARDPFLPAARLAEVVELFLAGADPRAALASPLIARYPSPPPLFLQVSQTEILRDDTLRMADHLRAEGAPVTLDLWDDCPHVWAMFQGYLPEADEALRRIAGFIRSTLHAR